MFRSNIRKALLAKGYFPKELPPVFTTSHFGSQVDEILTDWQHGGVFSCDRKSKSRSAYEYRLTESESEIISKPKRGYERRNLHITHPVQQALIAWEMSENWKSIQKWLCRQRFSEDKMQVSDVYERSIKGINFQLHRSKISYIEATFDWLVKTDITRFYPSIYTHSIPWAAYGKERVKQDRKSYKGSFADRLDALVRSCNRNQTIGIPIGPETSRIIAEVISSRIDDDFTKRCDSVHAYSIDRQQDDWVVGTKSLDAAEKALSTISRVYRAYGLEINGGKTSIEHIVASQAPTWISEMGSFLSHRSGSLSGARLSEFLTMCLRLQSVNPTDPVMNYALAVIEGAAIRRSDLAAMESFLLKAAVISPISMDRICRIFLNLQHRTGGISTKRVRDRLLRLTETNLEKGNSYEVIWLLYTLRGLKRPITSKIIREITEDTWSSSIVLILLDMKDKGIWRGALATDAWEAAISEESVLRDWTWLLAYEGYRNGWLSDKDGLMAKPLLQPLIARNVVFYDPSKNVQKSKTAIRISRKQRRENQLDAQAKMRILRQIEVLDY